MSDEHHRGTDDDLTIAGQKRLLDRFGRLVARRADEETALPEQYARRDDGLKAEFQSQRDALGRRFKLQHESIAAEYEAAKADAEQQYDADNDQVATEHQQSMDRLLERYRIEIKAAKEARKETQENAVWNFDKAKQSPIAEFSAARQTCGAQRQAIATLVAEADALVKSRRISPPVVAPPAAPPPSDGDPQQRFSDAMLRGRRIIGETEGLWSARFIFEGWPVLTAFFGAVALAVMLYFGLSFGFWLALGAGVVGSIVLNLLLFLLVLPIARSRTLGCYQRFRDATGEAEAAVAAQHATAKEEFEPYYQALVDERDRKVKEADVLWKKTKRDLETERDDKLAQTKRRFDEQHQKISQTRQEQLAAADAEFPPRLEELKQEHEAQLIELTRDHQRRLDESRQAHDDLWRRLVDDWSQGVTELETAVDATAAFCQQHFPAWESIDWTTWKPSTDVPPAIRFGQFHVPVAQFPGGVPQHPELAIERTEHDLASLLTFPECPSLLVEADGEGREEAIRLMQNIMLRMLAALPAGKVRFTIIDPTGRGQNFSAFMHLADYDDQLVTSRIWTESTHINKRLTDITEHMENVIQKYLRNEFESIQQYNDHAGEVAEPYRVLVVANYPANFSDEAARRLMSISSSGPRCGVSTLISADMKMIKERKFDLTDLRSCAVTLRNCGGGFEYLDEPSHSITEYSGVPPVTENSGTGVSPVSHRRDAGSTESSSTTNIRLGQFALSVDAPPDDATFTTAVRAIGKAAEDSSRVEVPFASVTPADDDWWTADSRGGIDVPLGRAGATKLQYMRLGRGTSQHVLIAGKTGSGKSTLLNALITNLAASYSPDEIEFYLIDFKKGVEFKPYATYKLPQARVVAIESEREFGLSVLERLDEELKRRGDLFRSAGVQDVKAWRDMHPGERMPRILLIVDEFQELFVADDHVARESGLLMDRLVRQGRAFGMHVILGTQTLAGAYSLARSTIGQMAVRVALQCSESDAHLILSEDNTAARLLSRPGAAIYNDANGLIEGNNPFQVVWLPDFERESYLRRVAEMAEQRQAKTIPAIVFEGNVPSDPAANHLLTELIEQGPPAGTLSPKAWLGASVAIKDPTSIEFARHSGTNLLVVGQHEELAAGVLATTSVALAASGTGSGPGVPPVSANNGDLAKRPKFIILDGTRPEEPSFGFWRRLARSLSLSAEVFDPKQCAAAIEHAAGELQRRIDEADESARSLFVLVYNLSRFRELQKSDDDFGFTSFGEEEKTSPSKHFARLLREGPAYGVHTLLWCDSYNNLNRWCDRQTLRDLELRVLFQMSGTDSSNLIDSPQASQLGVNRAVLYNDERGEYEKFRPYGQPTDEWLGWVRRTLGSRFGSADEPSERLAASQRLAE